MAERVLLDTDIGSDVDDALALVLAVRSPEVDLLGVTTVGARTAVRARIAERLLELAGRPDIPVVHGISRPLPSERFGTFLPDGLWFGHEGRGILDDTEIEKLSLEDDGPAPDHLAEAVMSSLEPTTVVTIGPVTNVADALRRHPDMAANVRMIVVMGATILSTPVVGGVDRGPLAEFNLNADREAAATVLSSGIPLLLVPAEVTYRTRITEADVERLGGGDRAARMLGTLVETFMPIMRRLHENAGVPAQELDGFAAHLHDPLAVTAVVRPDLVETRQMTLGFGLDETGCFVVQEAADGGVEATVVVDADVEAVRSFVMGRLVGATGG